MFNHFNKNTLTAALAVFMLAPTLSMATDALVPGSKLEVTEIDFHKMDQRIDELKKTIEAIRTDYQKLSQNGSSGQNYRACFKDYENAFKTFTDSTDSTMQKYVDGLEGIRAAAQSGMDLIHTQQDILQGQINALASVEVTGSKKKAGKGILSSELKRLIKNGNASLADDYDSLKTKLDSSYQSVIQSLFTNQNLQTAYTEYRTLFFKNFGKVTAGVLLTVAPMPLPGLAWAYNDCDECAFGGVMNDLFDISAKYNTRKWGDTTATATSTDRSQNGNMALFPGCTTATCVRLMTLHYQDWIDRAQDLNQALKVGSNLKLTDWTKKEGRGKIGVFKKRIQEIAELTAQTLPPVQFSEGSGCDSVTESK